jgi:hypothetical protein
MSTKPKTNWGAVQRETSSKLHTAAVAEKDRLIKKQSEFIAELTKARDTALAISSARLHVPEIAAQNPEETEATAFAIASDWHVEETVDPKTVNGVNEFNLDIADARIAKFFRSILRLVEIERAGTKIDNLVLAMLGDFMTGYIHEELQESNGLSPTQTVLWLRQRIVAGIRLLVKNGGFKRIVVPCSIGNHGRTTKKMRHATAAANSFEWMMYHVMKDDVPEVEWQIADGYHNLIEVYGRIIRFHHGDNVMYQGGIGGLTIPMEKAIAGWNKGREIAPYMDVFGHHHTRMENPRFISNSSLIGYGAFSLAIKAGFEQPSQTFFLLDSKRGRTGTFPIFL